MSRDIDHEIMDMIDEFVLMFCDFLYFICQVLGDAAAAFVIQAFVFHDSELDGHWCSSQPLESILGLRAFFSIYKVVYRCSAINWNISLNHVDDFQVMG